MTIQYCFMFVVAIWTLIGAKNYLLMVRQSNRITVIDLFCSLLVGICCGLLAKRIFLTPNESICSESSMGYSSFYNQEYEESTMSGGVVGCSVRKKI